MNESSGSKKRERGVLEAKGWRTCFVKGQVINILRFAGHIQSLLYTYPLPPLPFKHVKTTLS